jgi:hypothetical protein
VEDVTPELGVVLKVDHELFDWSLALGIVGVDNRVYVVNKTT